MKFLATIIPLALIAATICAVFSPAVSGAATFGLGVLSLISLKFASEVSK